MARDFVRASNHVADYTSAPAASAMPFTMAGWVYPDTLTGGAKYTVVNINDNAGAHYAALWLVEDGGSFKVGVEIAAGAAAKRAFTSTTPSTGAWQHVAAVCASSSSRATYLSGGGKVENTDSLSGTFTPTRTSIGGFSSGVTGFGFDGRIAEVGIWTVALDDAEIAALAKGFSPLLIRPQSLAAYYPIFGNDSPELDRWKNRYDLTLSGPPTKADHPRIYYPTPAMYGGPPSDFRVTVAPLAIGVVLPTAYSIPYVVSPLAIGLALPATTLAEMATVSPLAIGVALPDVRLIGEFDISVLVNSTARHTNVLPMQGTPWSTLSTSEALNDEPDTATFRVKGFTPLEGQPVEISYGFSKVFGGSIAEVVQVNVGSRENIEYDLYCVDWTRLLNRRLVNAVYPESESVTDILLDLIANNGSGFTTVNVDSDLDAVTLQGGIELMDLPLAVAISRVMKRAGGYWYVDADRDLHAFFEDTADPPNAITDLSTPEIERLVIRTNINQIRTRVFVEGGGSTCPIIATVGLTSIPVVDATTWYDLVSGGLLKFGHNRATYTHGNAGGGGALAGSLLFPTTSPTAALAVNTGVTTGAHYYAVTFYDGTGETTPGPNSSTVITGGTISAPGSAPTAAKVLGGNLNEGSYYYAVTFVDSAGGETTASSNSNILSLDTVTAPGPGSANPTNVGSLTPSSLYSYKVTFVTSDGGETLPSSAFTTTLGAGETGVNLTSIPTSGHAMVSARRIYRTVAGGAGNHKLLATLNDNTTTGYEDRTADGGLGADAPSASTALWRQVSLTGIPVSADPNVVSRKIYRIAVNGSQLKLVTTIGNNTATTYSDNTADGSLGANVPVSNTAVYGRVSLASIPLGPSGTTGRKIYRTAAGGSQLKLLTTIANNSTTTYADSTADGSLGTNVPTSNTSVLTSPTGTVNAGSTSIPVTGVGSFVAAGGWILAAGQYISYTGVTSSALTGVPASGAGAITATLNYGTEILAIPSLHGIPSSGAGSIVYEVPANEAANVLAQADDAAAQAIMAALEGGDGIHEHALQDQRLSLDTAAARAEAELERFKSAIVAVTYETHDPLTRTGKTITFDLGSPTNLSGDFTIQRVTRSEFTGLPHSYPRCVVEASNVKFSLEDLLRRALLEQSS